MTNTEPTLERKPRAANAPTLPVPRRRSIPRQIFDFFSSLRLTVVFLSLGVLLVFFGTIAQVDHGLYEAQHRYFRSLVIWWTPKGADWKLPVFPGGYLVGGVLLINLVAAHFKRFQLSKKKIGISLTHAGIVLLLLGQFATDMLQVESGMRLAEGEAKNYSESGRDNELVLIDRSDPNRDHLVAIPQQVLEKRKEIRHEQLPFTIRVKNFYPHSQLLDISKSGGTPASNNGIGRNAAVRALPRVTDMESRDVPSAVIEAIAPGGKSLGTWLVSSYLEDAQPIAVGDKSYFVTLRFTRFYKPFSLELLKFTHEIYKGTDIPKNFASRVRIDNPNTGENREVLIYMNNPLRYNGETYYQSGFAPDNDARVNKVTILQVVRNPGWLTPYFACGLVALGLVWQFMMHLIGFVSKRRTA